MRFCECLTLAHAEQGKGEHLGEPGSGFQRLIDGKSRQIKHWINGDTSGLSKHRYEARLDNEVVTLLPDLLLLTLLCDALLHSLIGYFNVVLYELLHHA